MSSQDPEDLFSGEGAIDEEDIAVLRNLLYENTDPAMRQQAAEGLGEAGRALREPKRGEIVDDLITAVLRDQNDEVRATAIDALYFIDADHIDDLVGAIANQLKHQQTTARPAEYFLPWLTATASEFRIVGAAAMEQFGDGSTVSELESVLSDPDPRVRVRAVRAYASYGTRADPEPLQSMLEDRNSVVRQATARALGEIGTDRAFEVLVSATQASDRQLRLAAVTELKQFDTTASVEVLIQSLVDTSSVVRYRSVLSLLRISATTDRIDVGEVPGRIYETTGTSEMNTLADTLFEVATDAKDDGVQRRIRIQAVWILGELSRLDGRSELSQSLVNLFRDSENAVADLASAYLKRLQGETIERELQKIISDSAVTLEKGDVAKRILKRVKRNAAAPIEAQSIEYTYVQTPKDYTVKYDDEPSG